MRAKMMGGYAYLFRKPPSKPECKLVRWRTASDDHWEIVVYSPTGKECALGKREIDGAVCVVFECPDGKLRAQTEVSVVVAP